MRKAKPPDEKNTPQGTQPQAGQGDDAPKYVTEEQLNRAISARFNDFSKKLEKANEGLASTLTTKLEELVTGKLDALKPAGDGEGKGTKGAPTESPELKSALKRIDDMSRQLETERQEKLAEKANARAKDLRQQVTEALTAAGISGVALKHAVSVLVDGEKRAKFDEEGERVLFRSDDDDLPLADGVKRWMKSDDAKIYLPPRGTQGSGDHAGGQRGPSGKGDKPMSAGAALLGMIPGFSGGSSD